MSLSDKRGVCYAKFIRVVELGKKKYVVFIHRWFRFMVKVKTSIDFEKKWMMGLQRSTSTFSSAFKSAQERVCSWEWHLIAEDFWSISASKFKVSNSCGSDFEFSLLLSKKKIKTPSFTLSHYNNTTRSDVSRGGRRLASLRSSLCQSRSFSLFNAPAFETTFDFSRCVSARGP